MINLLLIWRTRRWITQCTAFCWRFASFDAKGRQLAYGESAVLSCAQATGSRHPSDTERAMIVLVLKVVGLIAFLATLVGGLINRQVH